MAGIIIFSTPWSIKEWKEWRQETKLLEALSLVVLVRSTIVGRLLQRCWRLFPLTAKIEDPGNWDFDPPDMDLRRWFPVMST
jgi:hypothetical protein